MNPEEIAKLYLSGGSLDAAAPAPEAEEDDAVKAIAAKYLSEVSAQEPEQEAKDEAPEFIDRSRDRLQLALHDAISTRVGDTYGRGGQEDTEKYDWFGPDIISPERNIAAAADLFRGVGDVAGDAFMTYAPEPIKEGLSAAMEWASENKEGHPIYNNVGLEQAREDLKEFSPELYPLIADTATVASYVAPTMLPKAPFGNNLLARSTEAVNKLRRSDIAKRWQPTKIKDAPGRISQHRTKRDTYKETKAEAQRYKDLEEIPELDPRAPYKTTYNVIDDEIERLRVKLDKDLLYEDQIPFNEVTNTVGGALDDIHRNSSLVGDAKALAENIYEEFIRRLNDIDEAGTVRPGALLQLRRDIDKWVSAGKEGAAFDASVINAQQIALEAIRRKINEVVIANSKKAGTAESLRRQSSLYTSRDKIEIRADAEAPTPLGRAIQRTHEKGGLSLPHSPAAVEQNVQLLPLAIGAGMAGYANLGRFGRKTFRLGGSVLEKAAQQGYQAGRGPLTLAAFNRPDEEGE